MVQLGETTVKTNVFRKFGPSNRPSGGVVGIYIHGTSDWLLVGFGWLGVPWLIEVGGFTLLVL